MLLHNHTKLSTLNKFVSENFDIMEYIIYLLKRLTFYHDISCRIYNSTVKTSVCLNNRYRRFLDPKNFIVNICSNRNNLRTRYDSNNLFILTTRSII